jgi:hypothetical protein
VDWGAAATRDRRRTDQGGETGGRGREESEDMQEDSLLPLFSMTYGTRGEIEA